MCDAGDKWYNQFKEYSINGSIVVSKTLGRCSNHLALVKKDLGSKLKY